MATRGADWYRGAVISLDALVRPDKYPRSSKYDPQWMVDNCMGPNPLWLLEDLSQDCTFRPGMKVLDLGCGLGMTSIFLARDYDVEVWASELWIPAEDNAARFDRAGVGHQVHAVRAEAHDLPFEPEQFDAIVSVDSYHYFGTDDLYLGYLSKFLKTGGQLAIAVPSLHRELRELGGIPAHLRSGVGVGGPVLPHARVVAFPVGADRTGRGRCEPGTTRWLARLEAVVRGLRRALLGRARQTRVSGHDPHARRRPRRTPDLRARHRPEERSSGVIPRIS